MSPGCLARSSCLSGRATSSARDGCAAEDAGLGGEPSVRKAGQVPVGVPAGLVVPSPSRPANRPTIEGTLHQLTWRATRQDAIEVEDGAPTIQPGAQLAPDDPQLLVAPGVAERQGVERRQRLTMPLEQQQRIYPRHPR